MIYIKVPDMNDSMSSITLDGEEYVVRFTYNEKYDFWNFGVYDDKKNPIVAMTKVVPNFPLMFYYHDIALPRGVFGCISCVDNVGRNAFKDGTAEFVFIPNAELEG